MGIQIIGESIGETGIVARIKGSPDGPTIALRADMDALLQNETAENNPRSKKEGVMHACGHDLHVAGLLGAANILKDLADKKELKGDVVLIFQPNEDMAVKFESRAVKAVEFLEKNGLRDKIKAFFALHVFSQMERGEILLSDDLQMAGSGMFDLKLKTKGGHGIDIKTLPDIDYILSDIKIKVSEVMEEYWRKNEALVESMAPKTKSQIADNIILSEAGRTWTLRITSPKHKEVAREVHKKLKEVIIGAINGHLEDLKKRIAEKGLNRTAEEMNIEVEMDIKPNYRPVIHRNKDLVNLADKSAEETLKGYQRTNKGILASEDFSFYLEKFMGKEIPGVFIMVGAANTEKGFAKKSHHSTYFNIDPEVLKDLSALHADFSVKALDYFIDKKSNVQKKI